MESQAVFQAKTEAKKCSIELPSRTQSTSATGGSRQSREAWVGPSTKLCRSRPRSKYVVVQLKFTAEIEVFYMLFDRSLSIFNMTSLKEHMEYLNFRCKIQLDLPV